MDAEMLRETDDSTRWYVVRTKPKQESRAEMNLIAHGVEVLAPKVREARYSRTYSGIAHSISPLFPCYVFARFDAVDLLPKVRLTRGVQSVVGFGEYATPVEDAIVELIRGRIQQDGFVRIEEPRPGDPVKVIDGPLRSLTGIFECRRGHDRAVVLLGILGTQVHAEIPLVAVRRTAAV